MSRIFASTAALVFALVTGAPVEAAGALNAARQVHVPYSDLNLRRAEGAAELLARLQSASEAVCGGALSQRDLRSRADHKACVKDAMDRAVVSVPSRLVAEMYAAQPVQAASSP